MRRMFFAAATLAISLNVNASSVIDGDSISLDDVIVTGTRTATTARNLPMTVSILDRTKLVENQRVNILPTLTEQVPGFFSTQRGMMGYGVSDGAAGGIMMRGISSGAGQLLVLIDGHPQYQGVFGHSISDSYQTMMAERVEVLRGPASVLYGSNAMGGVINIITRGAKQDGDFYHVSLGAGSYGTLQAEISNVYRKGKFSSTIALQYGRSDNHRPRMGFEQYGDYVKLGYDFSEHWNAFADLNLTHFNSSYPGTTDSPLFEADQWITRGVATLALENHYDNTNGRLSVYDNFGRHKINDGYGPKKNNNVPQTELFRSKDALTGVSWYQSASLFSGSNITVGIDYQHIYGRAYYTSRETGEVVTAGRRGMQSTHTHSDEIAGYVDIRQDVTDWLTLDAGVRFDHHSVAGNEWIPQFGVVGKTSNNSELKAVVSKGFRNPTTKELYLYGTANHDSLRAERLWNYEISWRHSIDRLTYGVNLFIIRGDNMIQTVKSMNINTGEIKNRGAEIEATYRINSHWTVNTNHSFLNMKYHVLGAPEYKGYVGANMNYGKWTATMGLQQICGLFQEVNSANPSQDKKADFTLLNMTVGYKAIDNVQLWVKGDNLLAQKYEIIAGYPMPRATFMAGVNINF